MDMSMDALVKVGKNSVGGVGKKACRKRKRKRKKHAEKVKQEKTSSTAAAQRRRMHHVAARNCVCGSVHLSSLCAQSGRRRRGAALRRRRRGGGGRRSSSGSNNGFPLPRVHTSSAHHWYFFRSMKPQVDAASMKPHVTEAIASLCSTHQPVVFPVPLLS